MEAVSLMLLEQCTLSDHHITDKMHTHAGQQTQVPENSTMVAYTCWSANTGAGEFNHGSRQCFLNNYGGDHGVLRCHVRECDILTEFKMCKQDNLPKVKGGRTVRLEGSDHVPVFICFEGVPDLPVRSVPSFAVCYVPEKANAVEVEGESSSLSSQSLSLGSSCEDVKLPSQKSVVESLPSRMETYTHLESKKRTKHGHCSHPTLTSFFQRNAPCTNVIFSTHAEAFTFEESYVPFKFRRNKFYSRTYWEDYEVDATWLDEK